MSELKPPDTETASNGQGQDCCPLAGDARVVRQLITDVATIKMAVCGNPSIGVISIHERIEQIDNRVKQLDNDRIAHEAVTRWRSAAIATGITVVGIILDLLFKHLVKP